MEMGIFVTRGVGAERHAVLGDRRVGKTERADAAGRYPVSSLRATSRYRVHLPELDLEVCGHARDRDDFRDLTVGLY